MGVLKIPQIPQYGVLIEETYGKDDSLFHDVYKGAAKNVADIISGLSENTNERFSNPCIAFVGKRGTGKSSAMVSFADYLKNSPDKNSTWIDDKKIEETIKKASYYVLPPIDTANMGEKETIVADVSATMYSEFKKLKFDVPVELKRSFLEYAKKTNDSATLKNSSKLNELGDQLLAETDNIVNIKKSFGKCVEKFLEIVNKGNLKEEHFLVIQIDDLDMNVSNSFVIMEEIRNILSVKNVIILLSVDIKQLKTIFKIHFESSLGKNLSKSNDTKRAASDLAYKYIEKLLPIERRHYMPELTTDQLHLHKSENFLGDGDINWKKMGLSGINEHDKTPSVINAVMHLIWRKTMMIPMQNEYGDYILLPHNLRSLCNLIVFLRGMKDAAYDMDNWLSDTPIPLTYFDFFNKKDSETYRNILENNLRKFNNYIISSLETCERSEMNSEDNELADLLLVLIETLSDVYISEINSKLVGDIVRGIHEKGSTYYLVWLDDENNTDALMDAIRYKDTVSIGDVMYVLGKIDKKTHCGYIRYLIQIIRTLWSIRMTLEVYVTGCSFENKNQSNLSRFITKNFRDLVGAMIINPDKTEVFYWDKKGVNNDWTFHENKQTLNQSIFDLTFPRNDCIETSSEKPVNIKKWRNHLSDGLPIYYGHYDQRQNYSFSHPMALFSNLLYPNLIEASKGENDKKFVHWQKMFIMVFPFYSMDYMFRLYEKYIEQIRQDPFDGVSVMVYVLDCIETASQELWKKEISHYIPYVPIPKSEDWEQLPFLTETDREELSKEHFVFEAPIKALKKTIDWKKSLVIINKVFVEKLRGAKIKLEPITTFTEAFSNDSIVKLRESIATNLPSIVFETEDCKFKSHDTLNDSKTKINNILDTVDGNRNIVPFYYFDESISFPYISNKKKGNNKKEGNNKKDVNQ